MTLQKTKKMASCDSHFLRTVTTRMATAAAIVSMADVVSSRFRRAALLDQLDRWTAACSWPVYTTSSSSAIRKWKYSQQQQQQQSVSHIVGSQREDEEEEEKEINHCYCLSSFFFIGYCPIPQRGIVFSIRFDQRLPCRETEKSRHRRWFIDACRFLPAVQFTFTQQRNLFLVKRRYFFFLSKEIQLQVHLYWLIIR